MEDYKKILEDWDKIWNIEPVKEDKINPDIKKGDVQNIFNTIFRDEIVQDNKVKELYFKFKRIKK